MFFYSEIAINSEKINIPWNNMRTVVINIFCLKYLSMVPDVIHGFLEFAPSGRVEEMFDAILHLDLLSIARGHVSEGQKGQTTGSVVS